MAAIRRRKPIRAVTIMPLAGRFSGKTAQTACLLCMAALIGSGTKRVAEIWTITPPFRAFRRHADLRRLHRKAWTNSANATPAADGDAEPPGGGGLEDRPRDQLRRRNRHLPLGAWACCQRTLVMGVGNTNTPHDDVWIFIEHAIGSATDARRARRADPPARGTISSRIAHPRDAVVAAAYLARRQAGAGRADRRRRAIRHRDRLGAAAVAWSPTFWLWTGQRADTRPGSSFARMHTLRRRRITPDRISICPGSGYQAWHEARYGRPPWRVLDPIARQDRAADLRGSATLSVSPCGCSSAAIDLAPAADGLLCGDPRRSARPFARKVVLATGQMAPASGGCRISWPLCPRGSALTRPIRSTSPRYAAGVWPCSAPAPPRSTTRRWRWKPARPM